MVLRPSLTLQVNQHAFRRFVAVSRMWRRQGPEHAHLVYRQGSLDHRTDCPLRKRGPYMRCMQGSCNLHWLTKCIFAGKERGGQRLHEAQVVRT